MAQAASVNCYPDPQPLPTRRRGAHRACRNCPTSNSMAHALAGRSTAGRPASFGLDVRGLDDGPPFLDFGFVIGGKCLRPLLLGRWGDLAELVEPLLHRGVGECGTDDALSVVATSCGVFSGAPTANPPARIRWWRAGHSPSPGVAEPAALPASCIPKFQPQSR